MVGISKNVVKTSEKSNDIKSTLAAYTAASAVPLGALPAQLLAANKMSKISRNLDKDTVEIVNKAADDVLDKLTNLGKKGVKINNFQNAGINATGLPDKVLEIVNPLFATANGKNAFLQISPCRLLILQQTRLLLTEINFLYQRSMNLDMLIILIIQNFGRQCKSKNSFHASCEHLCSSSCSYKRY